MKLVLKNIGKVQNATVEINGITVIAGENDTGKSTVGKALFSVFNGFYNIDKEIISEREKSIESQLALMLGSLKTFEFFNTNPSALAKEIIAIAEKTKLESELQKAIYSAIAAHNDKISASVPEDVILTSVNHIIKVLSVPYEEILRSVLQKKLDAEFRGQIGNVFLEKDSSIQLVIHNENTEVGISDNKVTGIKNPIRLNTEVIYIDDPFILDELSEPLPRIWFGTLQFLDHRSCLQSYLNTASNASVNTFNIVDEIVANEKFEQIYQKISTVCAGNIVKEKQSSVGYRIDNHQLDVRNMSTGLKTFAILKSLLTSGYIKANGTIILDEPEIHLHPEWQLLFAELIVLLHKEFDLHILLNTHSPYFLNAIEVYAAKYRVSDKCKYYLTENVDKVSQIENVTDNIEKIYSKLARPLQVLENERYRYEGV